MTSIIPLCSVSEREQDPLIPYLGDFQEFLRQVGLTKPVIRKYTHYSRHFMIWLKREGIRVQSIDDGMLRRFRDHACRCPRYHRSWQRGKPRRTHSGMAGVTKLVGFFEQSGRTPHPGEQAQASGWLKAYARHLSGNAYRPYTQQSYGCVSRHLLAWLHQSRISMSTLNAEVVQRFLGHDCLCAGFTRGISDTAQNRSAVHRFVAWMVSRGGVTDESRMPPQIVQPPLPEFGHWLRRHRGIQASTIHPYQRRVDQLLPHLGDPPQYDAARIREALLSCFQSCSVSVAQALAGSMRMYLRFLSSRGGCPPGLLGAVPSPPTWRLSSLPRYLQPEQVERVIAACDPTNPAGLRDRAMGLLMARLGLRSGDIRGLKIRDIDWARAQIRVCGKSRRTAALPLPQDAGDAVLAYLEKGRPRSARESLFLTAVAPYRPIRTSGTISTIVARSLQRAGIETNGPRGAHLLRHSAATNLIRAGATLDQVQALLRHRSADSTAIYAKVDAPMLASIAQPWPGGGQ